MKHAVILTGLLLSSTCQHGIHGQESNKSNKKNVLFVAVDDLKPLLSCYGDRIAKTPNIDRLVKRGSVFTQSYCQQAVSGPTRASLLTGLRPDNTGVWDLVTQIRKKNPDVVTLPQHFKNNGYQTAGIGKIFHSTTVDHGKDAVSWSVPYLNHQDYFDPQYPHPSNTQFQLPATRELVAKYEQEAIAKGLGPGKRSDYIKKRIRPSTEAADVSDEAYTDGAIAAGTVKFLNDYQQDKPFFLAVGFMRPHLPFCSPKKYWELYDRNDFRPAEFRKRSADSPEFAYHNSSELVNYTDIRPIAQHSETDNLILPDEKAKELIHGYYAAISYMDAQLGKVLDALESNGFGDNTIIVFWGDHSWHLGDHGLWNKHSNFEQATHTTLLVADPDIKPNRVNAPVEFLDVYPTLCELTGLAQPFHLQGESFAALMKKQQGNRNKAYAVSQYPRTDKMGYSIRDHRYRYTVWVDWKNKTTDFNKVYAVELYDYQKDPLETVNYARNKEYASVLKQMETYWAEYIQTKQ
jgi:arylsulfatase A-like enzyme